ncbi:MAG: hypothetical protein L0216_07240 [Planctomycetales bacterium]|nr:hypothetical protein [Planctomycetales bacterium]
MSGESLRIGLLLSLAAGAGCGMIVESALLVDELQKDDDRPAPGPQAPGAPPSANVNTPVTGVTDRVPLSYSLADPEGTAAAIAVDWSPDAGATWNAASEGPGAPSEGTSGLGAAPGGTPHVFVWDSYADRGPTDTLVRVRVRPTDGATGAPGIAGTSGDFWVRGKLIVTLAGGAGAGPFNFPGAVLADSGGNLVVLDTLNHRVRVRNPGASAVTAYGVTVPAGGTATVAGTGLAGFNGDNQPATQAQLNFPRAGVLDGSDHLFVADTLNHRIRRVDRATGFVTTVCGSGVPGNGGNGGLATSAALDSPRGLALDGSGNLTIADTENHWIRFVNRTSSSVSLFAATVAPANVDRIVGTGAQGSGGDNNPAQNAQLKRPWGVALGAGGLLLIADSDNHTIRAANPGASPVSVGSVSVGAGKIDLVAGQKGKRGFVGDGGVATSAKLDTPAGVALDASGNLVVADGANGRIRVVNAGASSITVAGVTISGGAIATVAGGNASPGPNDGDGGAATSARLSGPEGVFVLPSTGHLLVADTGHSRIRGVNVGTTGTAIAGVSIAGGAVDTVAGVVLSQLPLLLPEDVAVAGGSVLVADAGGHRVLRLDLSTRALTVVAGNGSPGYTGDGGAAAQAALNAPASVSRDGSGRVYVSDSGNGVVRVVNTGASSATIAGVTVPAGAIATIPAGGGGLTAPAGVSVDGSGNVFVADAGDHTIRRIDASSGVVTVVAGTAATAGFAGDGGAATAARLSGPGGVSLDGSGNLVIADTGNHAVRVVNLGSATITVCGVSIAAGDIGTVAGTPPTPGYTGDNAAATSSALSSPRAAFLTPAGDLLVSDRGNHRVRRVAGGTGIVTTVAGTGLAGFNSDTYPAVNAHLNSPGGIARDAAGGILLADTQNRRVRRFGP